MKVKGFEWKDRKVLVTGASGFKGSWLCASLLRLGADVYGTIRNIRNPLSAYRIFGLEQDVVKVSADISDRQQVYDLLNSVEPDVIFHLAAKALVPVSLRDPRRTFEVNVMGTLNIIEACRKLRVCNRLLICSTDHVFGNVEPEELPKDKNGHIKGFNEATRVSYSGPYDTSKAAMELMVRSYHFTYWPELPTIRITRCANVFGFGDTNQRRVIPLFVESAVNEGVLPLKYRKSGRQFIHITDAVSGYIKAMSVLDEGGPGAKVGKERPEKRTPFTPTHHFAIEEYEGTNQPYITMESLAKQVASIFNVHIDDSKCVDYPRNENKIQALSCSETQAALQWHTQKSLGDSLKELGEWYRAGMNGQRLKELIEQDLAQLINSLVEQTSN